MQQALCTVCLSCLAKVFNRDACEVASYRLFGLYISQAPAVLTADAASYHDGSFVVCLLQEVPGTIQAACLCT